MSSAQINQVPTSSAFTPLAVPGCALWLDGADQTSMTLNQSTLTSWQDKSGNGYMALSFSNSVAPPTWASNVQNGRGVVQYAVGNGSFVSSFSITPAMTVFALYYPIGQTTNSPPIEHSVNSVLNPGFLLQAAANNFTIRGSIPGPANLVLSNVTMTWNAYTGAQTYTWTLYESTVGTTGPWTQINTASTASTSAAHTPMTIGNYYYFTVVVTTATGVSPPNASTPAQLVSSALLAPTNLSLTIPAGTSATATMAWTGSAGATTYSWILFTSATAAYVGTPLTSNSTASTSATFGITIGSYNYFSVRAVTAALISAAAFSAIVGQQIVPPTGLAITASATTVTMSWSAYTAATSYTWTLYSNSIYAYGGSQVTTGTVTGLPPATTATYSSATAGTYYYFTLTVTTPGGTGFTSGPASSGIAQSVIAPTVAPSITALSPTSTAVTPTFANGFYTYQFIATGNNTFTLTSPSSITAQALVVAGGGSGAGGSDGGGGGAGAALLSTLTLSSTSSPFTVLVGAGGTGVAAISPSFAGNNGSNSVAFGITAPGGGWGVGHYTPFNSNNGNGGCGGGAPTGDGPSSSNAFGIGSVGGNGGKGWNGYGFGGGGGGGMGGAGGDATSPAAGNGGPGASYTLGGSTYSLAGGGAGQGDAATAGTATNGGGATGASATPNTGGGGGAGNNTAGGSGGSGIVIVAVAPVPLGSPTNPTLTTSGTAATMSWTAAGGATGYSWNLYQSATNAYAGAVTATGTTTTATTATASTVTPGLYGYFTVAATLSGSSSAAVASSIVYQLPAPPSSLSVTPAGTSVAISWGAVAGATAYTYTIYSNTIYAYGGSQIATATLTGNPPTTSYTYPSGVAGTYYYFTVNVTTALGTSAIASSPIAQSVTQLAVTPRTFSNLTLWLDAGDSSSSSMTLSGSTVTTWKDKSSNAISLSSSGTSILNTTAFGVGSVVFSGSSLFFNSTFSLNFADHTAFFVGTPVGANPSRFISMSKLGGALDYASSNAFCYVTGSTPNQIIHYHNGSSTTITQTNRPMFVSQTQTNTNFTLYDNGAVASNSTTESFGVSSGIVLGAFAGGSDYSSYMANGGYINEIVMFSPALSDSNRLIMEGYIAWRWGIQTFLPPSHPYRNAVPMATTPAPTTPTLTINAGTASLSWTASTGATAYYWTLYQQASNVTTYLGSLVPTGIGSVSVPTTTSTFAGLSISSNYYYTVYSSNASGVSPAVASPVVQYIPNPFNLTLSISGTGASMTWSSTGTSPTFTYVLYQTTAYSYTTSTSTITTNTTSSSSATPTFTPVANAYYYYSLTQTTTVGTSSTYYSPVVQYVTPFLLTTTFSHTGANQSYTVPAGVTSLTVHMWGAGGANSGGTGGGAGAYINGTLAVTPASSLTIIVGGGGNLGTGSTAGVGGFGGGGNGGMYGPGGGGRSAIRLSSTELVNAGGGGACGGNATYGGCANFSPTLAIGTNPAGAGAQGIGTFSQSLNGMGGTQTAGGAASSTAQFGGTATAGTSLQGGAGATYGAGGGGGYYGGAGAGVLSTAAASGGGGSSYTTNANFTLISGSNAPGAPTVLSGAPATSSPYYASGVAVGAGSQSNGGNGLVAIVYPFSAPASPTLAISGGTATMSWTASAGATTYYWLLYSSATSNYNGTSNSAGSVSAPTVTATQGSLSLGTYYYYTVYSSNASGVSAVAASPVVQNLPNPYSLILSVTGSNATLSWLATGTSPTFYYTLIQTTVNAYTGGTQTTIAGPIATGSSNATVTFTPVASNYYFYTITQTTPAFSGASSTYQSPLAVVDVWANASAVVTTLAGDGTGAFADGTGTSARFYTPYAVAALSNGNIVVADANNHRIRLVTTAGVVTTIAGNGTNTFADGTGTNARFNSPFGIAVLSNGNLVVADGDNHRIRLITMPGGVVTTLAGNGTPAFADGTGTAARFNTPHAVAVLPNGNIVVADYNNHRIRLVTPEGVVTTVAGDGNSAFADGTGTNARVNGPFGIATFQNGNILVVDTFNHRIRIITMPSGVVTTVAGDGNPAFLNGTGTNASFKVPFGAAVLPNGNIIVADTDNHRIRLITMPGGAVTTLAGGNYAFDNGTGTNASFRAPRSVAVLPNGSIAVADGDNHRIRLITPT